ncbi:MAG TPA: HepT-like ribonuclease domain-containing protein [Anaerolineales bacterium]|nr:HepT-like ribonuclease domain-containing protein [Anaerolineales bacterium]
MPLDKRELSYLWDMQNAAREINEFMRGVKFSKFEKDKVLRYAAERLLLIIGEAANHVSPQLRNKHPKIPWAVFIRFRNILAHEYG